ncbi:FecCD family ABC transporter permease [Fluviispira multicolorata]|uniref:Iron chelate uptake ABC transporter family permease subunit n=1 Tax=Fluviispira multicolorata TaxID=2654512 RepID=A0A833JF57_9BACT|nr:iron ABC transporter permease [Fluviispira multicolorata]KAB8033554.1 iron chelate uptake ABC transporter family permease subunit [Fluviispira multicolorata]
MRALSNNSILNTKKFFLIYFFCIFLLIILFLYSLSLGPVYLSFEKVLQACFQSEDTFERRLIVETRLARTIMACLVGSSFAVAGVMLQSITKNPMACPSLLGVTQGAGLGIVVILALFPFCPLPVYLSCAVVGGIIASLLTYIVAVSVGISPLRLILAGQAINALLYALTQAILIFLPTRAGVILINLNGSVAGANWQQLTYVAPVLILLILIAIFNIKNLHILSFGKDVASSIGLRTEFLIAFFLFIIVLLCASSVSLAGPILFFPLIVVHFSKFVVGENPTHLLPFSIVFGAILMLFSDCLMRVVFANQEVPVGFFIALVGAPILILSSRMKRLLKNA